MYTEPAASGLPNSTPREGGDFDLSRLKTSRWLSEVAGGSPRVVTECSLTRSMLITGTILSIESIYGDTFYGTMTLL